MKKNGFTLIELIGIIIIIALVSLVVFPSLVNVTRNAEEKKKNENLNTLYLAAEDYVDLNYDDFTSLNMIGNHEYIKVLTLINENYVEAGMLNPNTNENFTGDDVIKITKTDEYTYSFVLTKLNGIYDTAKDLVYLNDVCKTDDTVYNYMNGCYIKGESTNNYVWYSGFLWRIMGINSDGTVRLISEDNLTSIPFYTNSTYSGSYAEKWLNKYLISNLKDASIIVNYSNWCSATASETETNNTSCTGSSFNDLVGLLSLDEYNLALASESYLNNNQSFYTLNPSTTEKLWLVNNGTVTTDSATNFNGLRAVINIRPEVIVTDGTGEISNPYFINKSSNTKTGNLNVLATTGEYLMFSNNLYRIVDINSDGTIKIISDDFYKTNTFSFGENNTFNLTAGIGLTLNDTVLNDASFISSTYKNMIVESNWYQNNFSTGSSYTVSLDETSTSTVVNAHIGLIRIGEMLSFQTNSSNLKNYWLLNSSSTSTESFSINTSSIVQTNTVTDSLYVKPVLNIKSDIKITSGNGTKELPYIIR